MSENHSENYKSRNSSRISGVSGKLRLPKDRTTVRLRKIKEAQTLARKIGRQEPGETRDPAIQRVVLLTGLTTAEVIAIWDGYKRRIDAEIMDVLRAVAIATDPQSTPQSSETRKEISDLEARVVRLEAKRRQSAA